MKPVRAKKPYTFSAGLLLVLLAASGCTRLSADTVEPEVIYGELMCTCGGCNQTLADCNHIGCPNSVPMRAEVDRYVEQGLDQEAILSLFAEKYGLNVLAAPPTAGWFNIASWLMPFVALTLGFGLVAFYARRFRGRWGQQAAPPVSEASAAIQKRLEDELADFTPDD